MKKIYSLFIFLLILSGCSSSSIGQQLKEVDEFKEVSNRDSHYPTYTMDITLDTTNHTVYGHETIEVFNHSQDEWATIDLRDYPSVINQNQYTDITDVMVSDESVSFHRDEDPSIIHITLNEPLKQNESLSLDLDFCAYFSVEAYERFSYKIDNYGKSNYALGQFYPVLSYYQDGNWVNHPYVYGGECFYNDIANYDITIHKPEQFTICGSSKEEVIDPTTSHYHLENARDFTFVISDDFCKLSDYVDGIEIECYCSSLYEETGQIYLETAKQAMQFFNRYLVKYPYDYFSIAQVEKIPGAGMEYPGLVMIKSTYFMTNTFKTNTITCKKTVIHELGHQWFYGLVGNDQYDNPWIDESITSAITYIFLREAKDFGYDYNLPKGANSLENQIKEAPTITITKSIEELKDQYTYVYSTGEKALLELEKKMGHENFMLALKEICETYSYKEAQTQQVLDIFLKYSDNIDKILDTYFR